MYIVHVFVQVNPESVSDFIEATIKNAQASLAEPGILRFDVIQEAGASDRFVLVEVYRTKEDPASHKQTAHYQEWNEAVEGMMAVPRSKRIFTNIFPGESGWE